LNIVRHSSESFFDLGELHHASVVDEDIHPPEFVFGPLDQSVRLLLVGYVAFDGERLASVLAVDPFDEVGESIVPAGGDHDRGALGGQDLRRRFADANGCARDDRGLAVELRHVGNPSYTRDISAERYLDTPNLNLRRG
jgi:hypothetical protein